MATSDYKLKINISAKILLLVLSLAILLASFGGYSVYVINSIGLKIERLNKIESVLETRINNMNSARIESANMTSTSAFTLMLAGMNATSDQVTAFKKTVQNADLKMEEGLAELEIAIKTIKVRLVPEAKPNSSFFYYVKKPTKGEKAKIKLKVKKYNPSTRKHEFFVEKKLPPHSK